MWERAHQTPNKDLKEKDILEMLSRSGLTTSELKEALERELERRREREKGEEGA